MDEKQLSGEESFKLINRMMYEAKGYFHESGSSALIYGFTIFTCSLLTYLQEKLIIRLPFAAFYLFIPVFFIQAFVHFKEEKKKKAKTFTDEAIDYVWSGYILAVLAALCGSFAHAGYIIVTIIIILTGFAAFLTGAIAKFKYDIVAGVICLTAGAVSFFIQNSAIYFLLAAAALLVWIIPGFIMRSIFKKQVHD